MISTLTTILLAHASASISGTVLNQGRPVRDAVIWLEGPVHATAGKGTVDQRHQAFEPHVQALTVGSRIDFPNNDDIFHNVYAEFQAKRFDLGVYPKGQSKHVTFDKTGVVSVLCNVHSQMSAYIVIVDTLYFAKTDKLGRYTIKGVADHAYTVHVWHESGKSTSKRLSKVTGNLTLNLELGH